MLEIHTTSRDFLGQIFNIHPSESQYEKNMKLDWPLAWTNAPIVFLLMRLVLLIPMAC